MPPAERSATPTTEQDNGAGHDPTTTTTIFTQPGVFGAEQPDELLAFFRAHGSAILRGAYDVSLMDAMEM